jgi:hypothetical protein
VCNVADDDPRDGRKLEGEGSWVSREKAKERTP